VIGYIFAAKLLVAVGVVIALSIITERVSPRIAGLISGLPTGSAITLFFIGLENGTEFASHTALYNMVGIIAMQGMLFVYYKSSARFKKNSLLLSAVASVAGYIAIIFLLQFLVLDKFTAVLLPLASIPVFIYLFRKIEDSKIKDRVKLRADVLLGRSIAAGSIILAVTETASAVGSKLAGLFTAFPTTVFPLILIVHHTYDAKHVHTIIKNLPVGLASLVAYSLTVSIAYPSIGIYYGTVAAFAAAFVAYGAIYLLYKQKQRLVLFLGD